MFIYNTWEPFNESIDESLIYTLIDKMAAAGADYFVIDSGWEFTYGDYSIHYGRFPHGLKPITDYIISKGMKPGVWISMSHTTDSTRVTKEHPDWLVKDRNGNPANLHATIPSSCYTMCLASPWYDYQKNEISELIRNLNLKYVKLDLASVYSAYKLNNYEAGCYAANHQHHDQTESLYLLYEKIYQFIDDLKLEFPDLFVDCTFELYGEIYGIDYSLIQHADGDWLSNISQKPPYGPFYARRLFYERGRIVPPSTLLIGNMQINWENSELTYQSLLTAKGLMLGDARLMPPEKIRKFRQWSDWARLMESKYEFSRYFQTSDVLGLPELINWDGCARINPEKGGIPCFFRNESPEIFRTFQIEWLKPDEKYNVYAAVSREKTGTFTGKELITDGLKVRIPGRNQAALFEREQIITKNK
jgi:alpha-galactosidase